MGAARNGCVQPLRGHLVVVGALAAGHEMRAGRQHAEVPRVVLFVEGRTQLTHSAGHHLAEQCVHLGPGQHGHQAGQHGNRDPCHDGAGTGGLLHVRQGAANPAVVDGVLESVQPGGVDAAVDVHRGVVHREFVRHVPGASELLDGVERHRPAQAVAQNVPGTGGIHHGPDIRNFGGHGVARRLLGGVAPAAPVVHVHRPALAQPLRQFHREGAVDRGGKERAADHHDAPFSRRIRGAVAVDSQPAAVVRWKYPFFHPPILGGKPAGQLKVRVAKSR